MSESERQGESSRQRALKEARIAVYMRLMQAQQRIAESLARSGMDDERFLEALAAVDADAADAEDCDVYLTELARYVRELGGHLEVRAVFGGESITVMSTEERDSGAR